MIERSEMMQLLPTVMDAKVEISFVRGWMAVFAPRAIRWVPVREACSAIMRDEASVVGGLGGGGIMEARLDDMFGIFCGVWRMCS